MNTTLTVLLVLLLILIEGAFVAAEFALVSLRESRVRAMAETGRRGAAVARLARDANRWLAAVQIAITLTALLSSAVGAVSLAERFAAWLEDQGVPGARALGVVGITLLITYVTLIIGEQVPKRLGIMRPEVVARGLAPTVDRFASLSRPFIWLLAKPTDVLVRLFGGGEPEGERISEEELRGIVATHESLSPDERELIDEVFSAGDRQVREVMIPRTEVAFLDASLSITRAIKEAQSHPHSRYPVVRGSSDDVAGFIHIRDLLTAPRRGGKLADFVRDVKVLPTTKRVLPALAEMRREGQHLAVVMDEYGGTAGIVTLEDLIEEVIGDIRDEYDEEAPAARTLRGGDTDVDGLLNLDEFQEQTGIELPDGPYETVAGFLMNRLGHVPKNGEAVEVDGARLKVTALDGRRVDRIRVTRTAESGGGDTG